MRRVAGQHKFGPVDVWYSAANLDPPSAAAIRPRVLSPIIAAATAPPHGTMTVEHLEGRRRPAARHEARELHVARDAVDGHEAAGAAPQVAEVLLQQGHRDGRAERLELPERLDQQNGAVGRVGARLRDAPHGLDVGAEALVAADQRVDAAAAAAVRECSSSWTHSRTMMPSPRGSGGATGLRRDARIDATTTRSATNTPMVVASMKGRPSIVYAVRFCKRRRVKKCVGGRGGGRRYDGAHAYFTAITLASRTASCREITRECYAELNIAVLGAFFATDSLCYGSNACSRVVLRKKRCQA